jgi:hypothetical protein
MAAAADIVEPRNIDRAHKYRHLGAPSIQRSLLNGWEMITLFEGRINKVAKAFPHAFAANSLSFESIMVA